ncbi:MAG: hypothetical protein ACE5FF_08060 [Saprospiraceae bacterium]
MKNTTTTTHSETNFIFWFHLFITVSAWALPILFWWPIVWAVYAIVHLQFAIFGRCLVNKMHDLDEEDDKILYTDVLEWLGFQPNRKKLKFFVRRVLYPVLGVFAVIWQVVFGMEPLLF